MKEIIHIDCETGETSTLNITQFSWYDRVMYDMLFESCANKTVHVYEDGHIAIYCIWE